MYWVYNLPKHRGMHRDLLGTGESSQGSDPQSCSSCPQVANRGRPLEPPVTIQKA